MKTQTHDSQKTDNGKSLMMFAAVVGLFLGGCVVTSVYPFYTAKDLMFEPALIGRWADAGTTDESTEVWQFERAGEKGYLLAVSEGSETNRYDAHLFGLKKQLFLDLCPTNRVDGHLPLHYVLKVSPIKTTLQMQFLADGWLKQLLKKNPKAIRHTIFYEKPGDTNSSTLALTAETKDLQKLILKYADDTNAFPEPMELKRRKE